VLRAGVPQALGGRAFDLLLALIERRGEVLSKDELMRRVWPGLVVEENNLTVHMSALRKAIGPAAISTVPGRGYQSPPRWRHWPTRTARRWATCLLRRRAM
jgi:DNA-binding winged helix-turn-helix (wHTH) protein